MIGVYDIAKYEGEKHKLAHYPTKKIFEFFEDNESQNKSLGGIDWTDYTRFPRTYEGAILALETFIDDLNEELINAN